MTNLKETLDNRLNSYNSGSNLEDEKIINNPQNDNINNPQQGFFSRMFGFFRRGWMWGWRGWMWGWRGWMWGWRGWR